MKKMILNSLSKFIFLSLYFFTVFPSEIKPTKKQDWNTFKKLIENGPNKSSEKKELKRRLQITRILNDYSEFAGNHINKKDIMTIAIQNHDNYILNFLLATQTNKKTDASSSLIFTAAHSENLNALKKLKHRYPESIFAIDQNNGVSVLHEVLHANQEDLNASNRRKKILLELLKTENTENLLNVQDNTGKTPLHLMAELGFSEEVILYCKKIKDDKDTPLRLKDNDGYTVFDYALIRKDMSLINFLIEFNPNLTLSYKSLRGDRKKILSVIDGNSNKERRSTLDRLLSKCNKNLISIALVNLLLNEGASINQGAERKKSILHLAIQQNDEKTFFYLIEQGARIHDHWNPDQSFLLHYAIEHKSSFSIKQYLIKNIKDFNAQDKNQDTALHSAVKNNDLETIKALLETDIDIDIKNNDEMTALEIAEKNMFLTAAYYLLNHKAALLKKKQKVETSDFGCSTEEFYDQEKQQHSDGKKSYCTIQ